MDGPLIFQFYSEVLANRVDGPEKDFKTLFAQIKFFDILNYNDLDQQIERACIEYNNQMQNLNALSESGFNIYSIKNFRLSVSSKKDVKMGCTNVKISNTLEKSELRGVQIIDQDSTDQNCLIYSLLCSLYFYQEKKKVHESYYNSDCCLG